MRPWAFLSLGATALLTCVSARSEAQTIDLDTLITRANRYVGEFVYRFANVVAEETYLQETVVSRSNLISGAGTMQGMTTGGSRRNLKSDFLLVRLPESEDYFPFRDVFEVDGALVRDREQRLTKLFIESRAGALEQAQKITLESARYNIGSLSRTFNNPIIALAFLQTTARPRFRYSLERQDRTAGANVWIVGYREQTRPTVIKGQRGRDIPARGQFWIDADTGRVLKTELTLNDPAVVATLTTTYRGDDRFQIDVPVEMKEQYAFGGSRVLGTATYGRFRRFDVTTDETLGSSVPAAAATTDRRTGLTLVEVPPGRFGMGSPPGEAGRIALERLHEVTIARSFYLGQHEVTQQEWRAVLGDAPSHFSDCGPRCPVENVSFDDAKRFLDALNASQASSELVYRLPTEAEWEYACRAGATTPFATGSAITTLQANFNGKEPYAASVPGLYRERPVRAGGFAPNAWGIADMHGNISEWTADWFEAYAPEAVSDPRGPSAGELRAIRGGSWASGGAALRCAARTGAAPSLRDPRIGLRIAADRAGARP
jgi:formylglycine-generating enzyme required for sulfatase activity